MSEPARGRAEELKFCKYCHEPKPQMVRVNDQHICYECAVARSDCRKGRL
ncbi:MAG: hypothetical protein IT480_18645 [Gammaproteobacteria bacterium]|nr:hypothetical protein [Gammaproteobacteria bacterium]